jgi:microcompartment protein CcmL/EutN
MQEAIIKAISENVLDIIIAVISIVVSYYIIPCIKNDLVPWLKDKHLYDTVKKFVQAVEKLAESGTIEKKDKKQEVIKLLKKQGIEVTDEIDAFIESAVKELDLVTNTIKEEIKEEETN